MIILQGRKSLKNTPIMPDIIRMLPDSVANQIAAGEVVQRPASAVKELLENTIDAGSTEVKLVIKDAGKTLIQVTDNGCGMSERDARMCFERHATSKIQAASDLMAIRTLGFRGEALASIASVSQVELRTRKPDNEIGTLLFIEGSEVKDHRPANTPIGTSILVKNLFFNVPARRNFLKSNTLELKYIMDEFFRVALVHPDVSFTFYNQDKVLYQLHPANLRQRIVALFGQSCNQKLIPVEQQTTMVNISGFVGKPEFAKKTRGEQFFFANGRFIRNPYLHHAVETAFRELLPKDSYPTYFLYMELDPANIDVNIHPTKTEINFTDSKSIYAILQAAVRQSLGMYNLTTVLDFEQEPSLEIPPLKPGQIISQPQITINPDYNPFEKRKEFQPSLRFENPARSNSQGHPSEKERKIFPVHERIPSEPLAALIDSLGDGHQEITGLQVESPAPPLFQIGRSYIMAETSEGIRFIDQQSAHERILYEEFMERTGRDGFRSAILPFKLSFTPDQAMLLKNMLPQFMDMGFEIVEFGNNDFLLQSVPQDLTGADFQGAIETALESLRSELPGKSREKDHALARSMAQSSAVKRGTILRQQEMELIFNKLGNCKVPDLSPSGKPTGFIITFDELSRKFKNQT